MDLAPETRNVMNARLDRVIETKSKLDLVGAELDVRGTP